MNLLRIVRRGLWHTSCARALTIRASSISTPAQVDAVDGQVVRYGDCWCLPSSSAEKGAKENAEAVAAKESTGEGAPAAAKPEPKPKKTAATSAAPAKPARTAKPATASPSVAGTNYVP